MTDFLSPWSMVAVDMKYEKGKMNYVSSSTWVFLFRLVDDHNILKQPPRLDKRPIDPETISLRHHLNPLDEERACQFIHDKHTLQGHHKSLYRWSTNNPLINIPGKRYKHPIQASINSPSQRLEERSKYIYRHLTPTKVWTKKPSSETLIFWNLFPHLSHSTLASEVLWQAPHQWPTLLPYTLHFFRIRLA